MGKNGLGKKLVFAAAAGGAILLVLRIVGGRSGGTDDDGDAIDRVDTGRSADDREDGTVETGLERVSTVNADDEAADDGSTATAETGTTTDADPTSGADEDAEDDEVPVEATGGRFDDLDLFDIISIVSAGVEAARDEYRNRA